MPKVVRKNEISREAVGEGLVEVEDFQQLVPLDRVEVTVRQRPYVGRRLANSGVLPERVAKYISLPWRKSCFTVITIVMTPFMYKIQTS